jgi:hypothetical protein
MKLKMKVMAASQNIRGQERAMLQTYKEADDSGDGKLPSSMQLSINNPKFAGQFTVGKLVTVEVTLVSLILMLVLLTGCSAVKKAYVAQPVYHPPVSVTNDATGEVTVTSPVWTTNYARNPQIDQGIDSITTIGSLTGIPYAGTVGAILALIYGAGATVVNRQNKNKAVTAITTLVENIESARDIIKTLPNGAGKSGTPRVFPR